MKNWHIEAFWETLNRWRYCDRPPGRRDEPPDFVNPVPRGLTEALKRVDVYRSMDRALIQYRLVNDDTGQIIML